MSTLPIKTRFAPSPTGHLHLGNARTALFNLLLARREEGRFVLRIEDTDAERSRDTYLHDLLEDLRWLGLDWDEGMAAGGDAGPYRQSERHAIYAGHYARLEALDRVYPCFCSREELALSRKAALAAGRPPRYSGKCAHLSADQAAGRLAAGEPATLRFRVPAGEAVGFTDLVRGPQRFASDEIGDFIVRRADGTPAFFFTNAVDDALMGITDVLRGEDHLANTPRQILLLEALGLAPPRYGHIALVTGREGGPLSKRHGALGVRDLREAGFLPGAVLNHLARLGHYYGHDEFLDLAGLAAAFDPGRLSRAPAAHDDARLLFWQKEAVHRAGADTLWPWFGAAVRECVPDAEAEAFSATARSNVLFPEQALALAEGIYAEALEIEGEALAVVQEADGEFFTAAVEALALHDTHFKALSEEVRRRTGARGKALFRPLRAALTGRLDGPELGRLLPLIGRERAARRLERWAGRR